MAEAVGAATAGDVNMSEVDVPAPNHVATSPPVDAAPSAPPLVSSSTLESLNASSPYSNVSPNDDDVQPPPAKRARKHSDADQASLANVRLSYLVRHCRRADLNKICCFSKDCHSSSNISVASTCTRTNEFYTKRQFDTYGEGSSNIQCGTIPLLSFDCSYVEEDESGRSLFEAC